MVLMTSRDEAMLEWLQVVRFANSEAVRWALPAIGSGGAVEPVHRRRAQAWIHRMAELGLVERGRLSMYADYVVWPSSLVTGRRGLNLFGQTMRHELAVAFTSARYLAYRWILQRHADRLEEDETARVIYLCTAEVARIVNREADRHLIRDLRGRLEDGPAFDRHGKWIHAT